MTFASYTADSGDDAPNPTPQTEIKVEEKGKEQKKAVVQPAVTGLSAKAGDGKVVLSWTNPTNEEFASLEVSYTPDESSLSKKTLSKTATTYTFSSLTNDTEYTFTVKAISSANTTETATVKATPKKLTTKLDAPTNLVVNSITETENGCAINISFTYNGKTELASKTTAILGYSTSNDSSEAIYGSNSAVTVGAGENTKTVTISNFKPELTERYYFWVKLTNTAENILDSDWSDVVKFTYLVSGKDTKYLARFVCTGATANEVNSFKDSNGKLYAKVDWDMVKVKGQAYFLENPRHRLNFTFKSLDEDKGTAYFYATPIAGYYIENGKAFPLPEHLSGNEFEINPKTNYFRCK